MSIELFLFSEELPGIHAVEADSEYKPDVEKFIKLESVQHGINRPVANFRPSAFSGAFRMGQLEHGCISASKKFDSSSISLLKAHLGTIEIPLVHIFGSRVVVTNGEEATRCQRAVLHIQLSDVVIADYQYCLDSDAAEDTFQLRYASIGWGVCPVKHGKEDRASSWYWSWWDGKKNLAQKDEDAGFQDNKDKATNADAMFKAAGFD
jgi:type VI protein secretion system component Hcp